MARWQDAGYSPIQHHVLRGNLASPMSPSKSLWSKDLWVYPQAEKASPMSPSKSMWVYPLTEKGARSNKTLNDFR